MQVQELIKEIEVYRNKMVSLASKSSLSNKDVIRVSKMLDELLNEYHSKK